MEHEGLTRSIIGAAMRVHSTLGPGFLESVYQRALAWELRSRGVPVQSERRLQVRYRGCLVGDFVADLLVGDCVIAELKAAESIAARHEAQLINYLAATGVELGVLLNFGAKRLEWRRKSRVYRTGSRRTKETQQTG